MFFFFCNISNLVGAHLQDHPGLSVVFNAAADTAEELAPKPRASSGLNGVAFFKTAVDEAHDAARGGLPSGPDVELICFSRADAGLGVRLLVSQANAAVGPALKVVTAAPEAAGRGAAPFHVSSA